MIKIFKDYSIIPASLDANSGTIGRNTHTKRLKLIEEGAYIDANPYNSRYKYPDTKDSLNDIYYGKCAYCEQKIEQLHVEHYRPKNIYYWLAFSWDNLLVACHKCNEYKSNNFDILGDKVELDNSIDLNNINNLGISYNEVEKPKMINPEIHNPEGKIEFNEDGSIESNDIAFSYTIDKCKLNRNYLNDNRRSILDRFKEDIDFVISDSKSVDEQRTRIITLVKQYHQHSNSRENEYLAFRKFSISKLWINKIIKSSILSNQ